MGHRSPPHTGHLFPGVVGQGTQQGREITGTGITGRHRQGGNHQIGNRVPDPIGEPSQRLDRAKPFQIPGQRLHLAPDDGVDHLGR